MPAIRCYTARGNRAHYKNPGEWNTFCWHQALNIELVPLKRRHKLVEAAMCYRCEKVKEANF